jgi:plastocyanin
LGLTVVGATTISACGAGGGSTTPSPTAPAATAGATTAGATTASAAPAGGAAITVVDPTTSIEPTTVAASTTEATTVASTVEPTADIVIKKFEYMVLPAKVGTITVRNEDPQSHTVTADDGSFNVTVAGNSTTSFEVATAGSYAIHCILPGHASMKATLVVS